MLVGEYGSPGGLAGSRGEFCVVTLLRFLFANVFSVLAYPKQYDAGDEAGDKNSLSHIALPPDIENDSFVATWGTFDIYNNDLRICQCWRAVGL